MSNPRLFRSFSDPALHIARQKNGVTAQLVQHLNPERKRYFDKKKPLVLVDWDGTLEDSRESIQKRLTLVHETLKDQYDVSYNVPEHNLKTPWTTERSEHMRNVFGKFAEEAEKLYLGFFNTDKVQRKAFTGSIVLIKQLREFNVPFAIVTNAWNDVISTGIKAFGWEAELQDVPVIPVERVGKEYKPNPQHFKVALHQLGVKDLAQREVIIIGDGVDSDMLGGLKFAKENVNVKVRCIWIDHGKKINCTMETYNSFKKMAENVVLRESIRPNF